jgi:SHS2 domain-containing protein
MSINYHTHTADVMMLIEAKKLQDLFTEGVIGMSNILKESFCIKPQKIDKKIIIRVLALDCTNLLIDFLSEVLTNSYVENLVFCRFEILEFSENKIVAELSGTHIEWFDEEIKAVTYHEANVIKNKKGLWETSIIFDI